MLRKFASQEQDGFTVTTFLYDDCEKRDYGKSKQALLDFLQSGEFVYHPDTHDVREVDNIFMWTAVYVESADFGAAHGFITLILVCEDGEHGFLLDA